MVEDHYTRTEADAGAFARALGGWFSDDTPSASELAEDYAEIARQRAAAIHAANERRRVEGQRIAAERKAAGLIRWVVGRERDPRFSPDMTQAELIAAGDCPVCGHAMVDCMGHSQWGDPNGWRVLVAHNGGLHERCKTRCNPAVVRPAVA